MLLWIISSLFLSFLIFIPLVFIYHHCVFSSSLILLYVFRKHPVFINWISYNVCLIANFRRALSGSPEYVCFLAKNGLSLLLTVKHSFLLSFCINMRKMLNLFQFPNKKPICKQFFCLCLILSFIPPFIALRKGKKAKKASEKEKSFNKKKIEFNCTIITIKFRWF